MLVGNTRAEAKAVRGMLESEPDIQLVGVAANDWAALRLILELRPDVVCYDVGMPGMDGQEFTRRVMAECPCPILILSNSSQARQIAKVLGMIEAGAIDVMAMPLAGLDNLASRKLAGKIRILRGALHTAKTSRCGDAGGTGCRQHHRHGRLDRGTTGVPTHPAPVTGEPWRAGCLRATHEPGIHGGHSQMAGRTDTHTRKNLFRAGGSASGD